jgi:RNA polymerase sigma-70 factor (TIGR02943 family)
MLPTEPKVNPHNWVDLHAEYLYAYAIMRIKDEEQSRDLVQETFLAALERVTQFEGRSTERTWLTAILRNKIVDVYRKRSSGLINQDINKAEMEQADFFNSYDGHWNSECAPQEFGIDDHDPLHNKELNRILQLCMKKLPPLWLAVFTMKHMDDESKEAICSELKVSDANFWVIIHRAKVNLRSCLQRNWI